MAIESRNVGGMPGTINRMVNRALPTRGVRWNAATGVGIVVCSSLLALLVGDHAHLAILAGLAVLLIGLYAVNPLMVVASAIPATLLVVRVGTASSSLSVSDLVLFVATFAALPF